MGCNQSKVAPGEPETKQLIIQAKSKGRHRCHPLKMFRKRFSSAVSPVPTASMVEEHNSLKSPHVIGVSSPATPPCQILEGPSDEDPKAGTLPFDDISRTAGDCEEVFAEGCNWDLPEIISSSEVVEMDPFITETTATIEEELELELDLLNQPSTPELNVTGVRIKPILTEEQVQEAIR